MRSIRRTRQMSQATICTTTKVSMKMAANPIALDRILTRLSLHRSRHTGEFAGRIGDPTGQECGDHPLVVALWQNQIFSEILRRLAPFGLIRRSYGLQE